MIYEIAKEIQTELEGKLVPHRVVYGPERAPLSMASPRIVIERNRDGNDTLAPPMSKPQNPKQIGIRSLACKCRIFAKSNVAGAASHDHEREADLLVDQITIALLKVCRRRCNTHRITSAKFLGAEALKLQGLEAWPGAVYEIEFEVDRGVVDVTWTGAKSLEATMGGAHGVSIKSEITVSGSGGSKPDSDLPSATTR